MTRSKRLLTERKHLPKLQRFDLSDVPSKHRVTNATTPPGSYSQIADWQNSAMRPGCLDFKNYLTHGLRC